MAEIKTTVRAMLAGGAVSVVKADEAYVRRVLDKPFDIETLLGLEGLVRHLGVTAEFKEVSF